MSGSYETGRSAELLRRARRVDASFLARTGLLPGAELAGAPYPVFAERASGAYVWDVDGNVYVDYMLGFGSVILGHADPRVAEAVRRELDVDSAPTLNRTTQLELCEFLVGAVPNVDLVLLVRSGSEATAIAVRLARAHTGRPVVLHSGYHGWHDWCAPRRAGLPPGSEPAMGFRHNDVEALERLLVAHEDRVACVVTIPFETELPEDGYLGAVRDLAHAHGALFVLDEVRTSFRLAIGGAQEYFGVDADLVAMGKALANGFALAAVGGRRDVMELLPELSASSTFFRHTEAMAAACATARALREDAVPEKIRRTGERLLAALETAARDFGLPARVVGHPSMPFVEFDVGDPDGARCRSRFVAEALARGVLVHPTHHWFVSAAHTEADVDRTADALTEA
ncbi:MAG: aminotransferase class III-fold pyridoxal phosphate-dependent enzyme, partial [Actinomycetota bacterium]|nr:aminotransferase class III-fold pyridoxal phosphate-dependent enzyme [Actinomycetota bacterium]